MNKPNDNLRIRILMKGRTPPREEGINRSALSTPEYEPAESTEATENNVDLSEVDDKLKAVSSRLSAIASERNIPELNDLKTEIDEACKLLGYPPAADTESLEADEGGPGEFSFIPASGA